MHGTCCYAIQRSADFKLYFWNLLIEVSRGRFKSFCSQSSKSTPQNIRQCRNALKENACWTWFHTFIFNIIIYVAARETQTHQKYLFFSRHCIVEIFVISEPFIHGWLTNTPVSFCTEFICELDILVLSETYTEHDEAKSLSWVLRFWSASV
jgi:hypothetical protein